MASISSQIFVSASAFQSRRLPSGPRAIVRFRLSASSDKDNGRLVDEGMIVLRMRIHEMQAAEKNDGMAPRDWMEWEKRCYESYGSDVCEFVGMIQSILLKSRPSVAVGTVILVAMAMPTSAFLISLQLMEMAKFLMHIG